MSNEEIIKNNRNRYKWNIAEILALQREYDLQGLTIQEIALLHNRTVFSIVNKLEKEKFIINYCDARGYEKLNFNEENNELGDNNSEEMDEDNEYTLDENKMIKQLNNIRDLLSESINEEVDISIDDELALLKNKLKMLNDRINNLENNSSFFTFIKNLFFSKRIC